MDDDALNFLIHETQGALQTLNNALSQIGISVSGSAIDEGRLSSNLSRAYEAAHFIDVAITSAAIFFRDDYALCTPMQEVRIYDALHRNIKRLAPVAKENGRRISVNGGTQRRCPVYPCFDLLFYLFLDNAVKYGVRGQPISVDVIEMPAYVKFRFQNLGPMLAPDEVENVVRLASRGEMARRAGQKGRGFGLALARHICELHEFEMKVVPPTKEKIRLNNVPYSDFIVEIEVRTE